MLLTLFFAWNVAQHVRAVGSKIKRNDKPCLIDTPTFISITGVRFDDQIFRTFCNDWINCRDTFHAALCL